MTKEEKREYYKDYYKANKEKRLAQNKAWKEKNKEYIKNYYQANKEKQTDQVKAYFESKKDGLFTVYLLVNEDYVGQTNCLWKRLISHRNKNDRDTSNVQIIGKYKTREQAKEVEAGYHARGYLGAHNNL